MWNYSIPSIFGANIFQNLGLPTHNNLSDAELLQLHKTTQNNEWLGILLQRYTLLLFGVCMKYFKNETLAKDGVQQIFLKSLANIPKHQIDFFKGWIYMVARNYCLMELRNKQSNITIDENIDAEEENVTTQLQEKEINLQWLEESLPQLNKEQQQCIYLFYLQQKTYHEIVDETNFTYMQVKSHIQNGKRNLKLLMDKKRSLSDE
jgi:RNA polymerase sigma-70 factor (ECF subfamily)